MLCPLKMQTNRQTDRYASLLSKSVMWFLLLMILRGSVVRCQFIECHDDPSLDPEEGPMNEMQFTWLGTLQYIHVKNGTPHYFRVPRVVLISRQFVLSTAVDAAQIPEGYALGNVAFGEYERDEAECGLTLERLSEGGECEQAALLVPLADVLLHPEYKHFGAVDSIALLKMVTPIKSHYMLPACLPFKNYLVWRAGRDKRSTIYHVDFSTDVPRDIVDEEKEVSKLNLLPKELCYLYDSANNVTDMPKNRIMCTTGCGFHSGAPSVVHEHTGHWSLVALAQGGSPCPDPLRQRRPPPPPRHILLHPYVPWITAAITGKAVGAFAKDDPFGFIMPRSVLDDEEQKWNGHWWMAGLRCFDRGEAAEDLFKFYHEIFSIKPTTQTYMTYYLELFAAHGNLITCIKVGMPYRLGSPRVWDLDSPQSRVVIPGLGFAHNYKFQVEAWAINDTESSSDTSDETDSNDS